jgi:hypothetical protein
MRGGDTVIEQGQDWLDKHEAARLSGYNPRTLTNKAKVGELRAEQRPVRGAVKGWFFWRADIEALKPGQPPQQ